MSEPAKVLVAGVGNVFLGDDGFGVEVARRLAAAELPEGVRAVDFGVRALHLAYELAEHDGSSLVLVDAMARGNPPGTIVVVDPDPVDLEPDDAALDAHVVHPALVLRLAQALGAKLRSVRVVGCEPSVVSEGMGLSAPVERAVGEAVRIVRDLAGELARA